MSLNDPISDMLTTIRNGQQVKLAYVKVPSSKAKKGILNTLKNEGFIQDFSEEEVTETIKKLKIDLKYFDGSAVIKEIKRISKPGLRVYSSISKLPRINNGLGIAILSTSKGIMADHEARTAKVSGEILCSVF